MNEPTEVSNVTYVGEGPDMVMNGGGSPADFEYVELAAVVTGTLSGRLFSFLL